MKPFALHQIIKWNVAIPVPPPLPAVTVSKTFKARVLLSVRNSVAAVSWFAELCQRLRYSPYPKHREPQVLHNLPRKLSTPINQMVSSFVPSHHVIGWRREDFTFSLPTQLNVGKNDSGLKAGSKIEEIISNINVMTVKRNVRTESRMRRTPVTVYSYRRLCPLGRERSCRTWRSFGC